jgi:calcium channel MID1
VNLPAPPFPLVAHTGATLPPAVTGPLLQYLANFTVTLGTFPCGRDAYSPLQTCAACQDAYRRWLCAVQFPRCAEPPPAPAAPAPAIVAQPPGALRNPNFPNATEPSAALLPCLETCTAVDRACPHFLGFGCPVARFNAASSYGVGFIDDAEAGLEGGGTTGVAQDRYGNVWCNTG